MKWFILLVGIGSNAAASLLVKKAVQPAREISLESPMSIVLNWPLMVGLGLYGGAFLMYALALTRLPINVAHPILTSGAIAVVAVGSALFYGESFRWTTVLGIVMVCVGVGFISQRSL